MPLNVFILINLLLLIGTLLPMLRQEIWWIRGLDFPRLQFCILGVILLIAECLLLDFSQPLSLPLILVTLVCLLYQGWWILPYTRLVRCEVQSADKQDVNAAHNFKIMTANVLMSNRQADKLINQVQHYQPDILVTLETDHWWQQQLDQLQSAYPYSIKCPQDNLYGMHVYSRLELNESEIKYLVEADIPSMHTQIKLSCGANVYTHFLHPAPPSPVENDKSTERDAELLAVAKTITEHNHPVIVTGDLNDVAWSKTTRLFRKISGLLDPRIGRGMFNTFHASYPFMRWPLDHLFHSKHFRLQHIERLHIEGSDHFALLTCLSYQPDKFNGDNGLHPDKGDQQLAEDKMQRKGVDTTDVPKP